ncbi:uncharacterized protein LOC110642648 [Hevea brasiliensis]|uniref:uncharacterized protein LOC110642648 n=1 Tax=Hevea brasiliensis TaxID=3981 RepID=UPI000B77B20C|nr:uncharacterized protein LOC110642648 [Hevea brasiliensis]
MMLKFTESTFWLLDTRNILCQTYQSITPWKATSVKLGHIVSICNRCTSGANLKEEEEEKSKETKDDVSTDNVDLSTGDEEDTDNQLAPWSSMTLPSVVSSSSSSTSNSQ